LLSVNGQETLLGPGNADLSASQRLPQVLAGYRPLKCQTGSKRRLPPVLDRTMDLGSGLQTLLHGFPVPTFVPSSTPQTQCTRHSVQGIVYKLNQCTVYRKGSVTSQLNFLQNISKLALKKIISRKKLAAGSLPI